MAFQTFPSRSTVGGFEQPAARSAARAAPSVNLELPHPRKQNTRIIWIHSHVRAARVFVDKKNLFPVLAAIGSAKDAPLRLRPIRMTERASKHRIRIVLVNQDVADPASLLQSHQRPGLARVHRFINSIANGNMASDERFARSCPHNIRVARRHRQRSNRRDRLRIKNGVPMQAAVGRLEDPSRGCAHIVDVRAARHSSYRGRPIANRTDVTELQLAVDVRIDLRLLRPDVMRGAEKRNYRSQYNTTHSL